MKQRRGAQNMPYHASLEPSALTIVSFPPGKASPWIERYLQEELAARDAKTVAAYERVLRDFATWLATKPGSRGQFVPQAMTKTALACYFEEKKAETRPSANK